MAHFEIDNLNITPQDYVMSCSEDEIDELRLLVNNDITNDNLYPRSYGKFEFFNFVEKIKKSWYSLSKEDVETIKDISNKC